MAVKSLCLVLFSMLLYNPVSANYTIRGKNGAEKKLYTVEQWKVAEITLTSGKSYPDPFNQLEVSATFSGPDGKIITRPAFWDGGNTWKIRFAPTAIGKWNMKTSCSDPSNTGLHQVTATVECKPYSGKLAIYQHGFLKVSKDKRYFVYDDGTPFFYLGDTHWIYIREHFDTSNIKGVASQFKYIVDKRVDQGFTVYQTEAIQSPQGQGAGSQEPYCNFKDGFTEQDIAGFRNIDRKFQYLADQGLVNANSAICWALEPADYPDVYTESYMAKLGTYWAARYGAYPVMWTIAQEIDKNMYKRYDSVSIGKWFAVAKAIADHDAYHHPLTAHMENTSATVASTSWWGDKPYHNWWAVQWQEGVRGDISKVAKDFWDHSPPKPSVLYESAYEGFWTDAKGARGAGYKAFQSGLFGYGYGANGVWNDLYSNDPPDYGTGYEMPVRYLSWYEGANLPGAKQLIYFKKFYEGFDWWKLVPRFTDTAWSDFADKGQSLLATCGDDVFVVYFYNRVPATGTLKHLEANATYTARWFNPRSGGFTLIRTFKAAGGSWLIPDKPDSDDWVLLVEKSK